MILQGADQTLYLLLETRYSQAGEIEGRLTAYHVDQETKRKGADA